MLLILACYSHQVASQDFLHSQWQDCLFSAFLKRFKNISVSGIIPGIIYGSAYKGSMCIILINQAM